MRKETITVPVSIELTKEESWEAIDDKTTSFFIVRFHFQLNKKILKETHKIGDWIGFYQSPNGLSSQHVRSETTEIETIDSKKAIEYKLLEDELLQEIASGLVTSFKLPSTLEITSELRGGISKKIRDAYTSGIEIYGSQRYKKTSTLTITNSFSPEETKAIVSVPVYRKRAIDILLAYIDFLRVDYKRSPLGLRKKCNKIPCIERDGVHRNRSRIGLPVATAYYWEIQPNASKFMYEEDHRVEVEDANKILISEPVCSKKQVVEFPEVPTLYQIATAAFPQKWIWRKSAQQEWTEEDLKKIELDEVKRKSYGWYHAYGNK